MLIVDFKIKTRHQNILITFLFRYIQEKMKITVKLFGKPLITLELRPDQTIQDIKAAIFKSEKIDIDQQRLIYLREPLDFDEKTLKECEIKDGAIIYLMLRLFVKKETPILAHQNTNRTQKLTKV